MANGKGRTFVIVFNNKGHKTYDLKQYMAQHSIITSLLRMEYFSNVFVIERYRYGQHCWNNMKRTNDNTHRYWPENISIWKLYHPTHNVFVLMLCCSHIKNSLNCLTFMHSFDAMPMHPLSGSCPDLTKNLTSWVSSSEHFQHYFNFKPFESAQEYLVSHSPYLPLSINISLPTKVQCQSNIIIFHGITHAFRFGFAIAWFIA